MANVPKVPKAPARLNSLDQFRGYTVAGMFLVNFIGGFAAAPFLCRHHNNFCSYADTIMPQFFFAVGFSMRLSFGRRALADGVGKAYMHAVLRCLGLALVAILWYGQGEKPFFPPGMEFNWDSMKQIGVWGAVWRQLKGPWFQTLLHIAVTMLWILPVIRANGWWRLAYLVFSAGLHLALNAYPCIPWQFPVAGAEPPQFEMRNITAFEWHNIHFKGIDGGPLGFLTWTIPTLIGTLACDWVMRVREGQGGVGGLVAKLTVWSLVLMALGWALSCGTRMYDVTGELDAEARKSVAKYAPQPVFPPAEVRTKWWGDLLAKKWDQALAEPPFVPPPHSQDKVEVNGKETTVNNSAQYRQWNYWMMSQQVGAISYLVFSAGLSLAVYLVFYLLADGAGISIGIFRTLGVNALFGYVLHEIVGNTVKSFMPKDIPTTPMWIGFGIFFCCCWLILRSLEKQRIYIKL